ncbi:MAG: hypothetical protein R2851_16765 [Caldilineaceae bacterium]
MDTTASDAPFDGSVPLDNLRLFNENGPNYDNNPNTVDVIIRTDGSSQAAVVLTESFGVTSVWKASPEHQPACYWITLRSSPINL